MKRRIITILAAVLCCSLLGCGKADETADIAVTTLPVYELTQRLCEGTDLRVQRIITENVSCLHDYTLQPDQMKAVASAKVTVISGAGLEDFMADMLPANVVDASGGIELHCPHHGHEHDHESDPHIWLSPENGKKMAQNIYAALCKYYPEKETAFAANLALLVKDFDDLIAYGKQELSYLSCKSIITFHDGFAYMAESYGLQILCAMEEESGSEASAKELTAICRMVTEHNIPAIFTEANGSDRAANIVSKETGAKVYTLSTGMADGYFDAMYHNIKTLKEALG